MAKIPERNTQGDGIIVDVNGVMRDFREMAVDLDIPPPKITVRNATPSQINNLTTLPLIEAATSDKQVVEANEGHSDQELSQGLVNCSLNTHQMKTNT